MLNRITKTIYGSQVNYDSSIGYYYDVVHNIGSEDIIIGVYDNSGKLMNTNGLLEKIDDNTLRVFFPNSSINYWTVFLFYDNGETIETAPKKRLFEQDQVAAADLSNYLDYNLAMGGPNLATYNVTIAQFKSFCQATFDSSLYLLKSNNLSDLNSVATARNNLDVYDKATVDSLFANVYPAEGYLASYGSFTDYGVFSDLVVNPVIDSRGISVNVSFTSGAHTYSNQGICQINITARTGVNLDLESDVMPLYMKKGDGSFGFGEIAIVPSGTGLTRTLTFNVSLYATATVSCSAVIHYNVNKA